MPVVQTFSNFIKIIISYFKSFFKALAAFITWPFKKMARYFRYLNTVRRGYYSYLSQLNDQIVSSPGSDIPKKQRQQLENLEAVKNANLARGVSLSICLIFILLLISMLIVSVFHVSDTEITGKFSLGGVYFQSRNSPGMNTSISSYSAIHLTNIRREGQVFDVTAYPEKGSAVKLSLVYPARPETYRIFYKGGNNLTVKISAFKLPNPAACSLDDYEKVECKDEEGRISLVTHKELQRAFDFRHHTQFFQIDNTDPVNWESQEFYADSIAFNEPINVSNTLFKSSIRNGRILFTETEKPAVAVTALDSLSLRFIGSAVSKVSGKNGQVFLDIKGRVSKINLISGYDHKHNISLMPTLAEWWLYYTPDYVFQAFGTLLFTFLTFLVFRQRKAI